MNGNFNGRPVPGHGEAGGKERGQASACPLFVFYG